MRCAKIQMNTAENIKINMLGEFAIYCGDEVVLKDEGRSRKVWNLLAYLIANRGRTLASGELPELLCSDDRSDDPAKAVKNLAYRLRIMLGDSNLPKEDYILQKGGTYRWNNDISVEVDIEDFDGYYRQARATTDEEKAQKYYLKAIQKYQGIFLPTFPYEEWSITLAAQYQHMFVDCVMQAHRLAKCEEDYETLIEICERAIQYDPYEEKIFRVYIDCLIKLDRQQDALSAYETITGRLYSEMGVNPSKELTSLYRQIIKTIKSVENDLVIIKDGLNEPGEVDGAYCSEYEIFKDVYRFVARGVERSGSSIFIMLCTLTDLHDGVPEQEYLTAGMAKLKDVIGSALRKGDLFAQYSCTQFVVMLPNLTYENGVMVGNRITSAFKKQSVSKYVKMHFKLQPLDPKGTK